MKNSEVRVDLHVHSSHSDAPYSWFLKSAKAAECYTLPEKVYQLAKARGMNLVTLSDHDTIEGALRLKDLHPEDTFISEEVSARFPEDGCVLHTIALDITEAQHGELQRLRRNIYELVQYMHDERIAYYWCHPMSQVNRRLETKHLEKGLLMFRALEARNGTRDPAHEARLRELLSQLTPERLARHAEKYPETPWLNRDASYALTGGSDDHGSLAIARAYTSFRGECSGAGVTDALFKCLTRPEGANAKPETLGHNVYGVVAGYFKSSGQLCTGAGEGKSNASLMGFLGERLSDLQAAAGRFSLDDIDAEGHSDRFQDRLYDVAQGALVRGWRRAFERMGTSIRQGRMSDAADSVSELLKQALLELPYTLSFRQHAHDRQDALDFSDALGASGIRSVHPRVAVFADAIDTMNGVGIGLRRLRHESSSRHLDMRLVTSGRNEKLEVDDEGVVRIPEVYSTSIADYPEIDWTFPHLGTMLRWLVVEKIDVVQCSTPGPVGWTALLAGRLAGKRVIGQYHTDLPEYVLRITGDPTVANIVTQLTGAFYRMMDRVLVPSRHVADIMTGMGVAPEKLVTVPRGVDLSRFSPRWRDDTAYDALGLGGHPKLLYLGRLSREKNLETLLDAFRALASTHPRARLVLVGDGPHAQTLRERAGAGVVFAGARSGTELSRLVASADVFVFPSETETFGNAVVEAQAAGLPVIVAGRGAAHERVQDGVTGLVVDAQDSRALTGAMARLLSDDALRKRMSQAAARHGLSYDSGDAAVGTFREYAQLWTGGRPDVALRRAG